MIEVNPNGNVPPYVDLNSPIPLGATRRTILITLAALLSSIGLISTLLFQQISKRDNNLRQRGRYLVTLQGLFSSLFLSLLLFYQAYKYRFPCIILYYGSYLGLVPYVMLLTGRGWRLISRVDRNHAIYLSRFAEPSDIAALQNSSLPTRRDRATFPPKERSNPSLINLASLRQRQGSDVQDPLDESDRIFELTQRSAREIAQSKKWYNRYRTVTDRQMLGVAALFMALSIIVAISFQVHTPGVSASPVIYVCHSGAEYFFPYGAIIFFLFVLSPIMVYQLKGIHDGFGIRKELIFISFFSAPCFICYFLIPAVAPDFTIRYVDRTTYMVLILVASHIPSIIMPLFRHFKNTPSNCPITSRAFKKKVPKETRSSVSNSAVKEPGMDDYDWSNGGDKDKSDAPESRWTPTATGAAAAAMAEEQEGESMVQSSEIQFPPVPAPTVDKQEISGREQPQMTSSITIQDNLHPHGSDRQHSLPSYYQQRHGRKQSTSNMNMSLRNLLKNSKMTHFNLGFGQHQQQQDLAELDNRKGDWEAFMKVLEDQELFERLSAFTVGEFCAENTRFLYEVSRLEKRAVQYEHLRQLTAMPVGETQQQQEQQQQTESSSLRHMYRTAGPHSSRQEKTVSTLTDHSTLSPLPTHFSSSFSREKHTNQGSDDESGMDPHQVKKIVSLSSVNSTAPLLRPRRSSSSYFDESEPSSPLGSSSIQSTFIRYGSGSATALPDLEEGGGRGDSIALQKLDRSFSTHHLSTALTTKETAVSSTTTLGDGYATASTTTTTTTTHHYKWLDLTDQTAAAAAAAKLLMPLPMPPTLLIQFEYVYKTFIQHGGRLELNLSYDTSLEIQRRAKLGDWRSGLFDSAIEEIQELLFRDVWPKFVSSPHGLYAALKSAAATTTRAAGTAVSVGGTSGHSSPMTSAPIVIGTGQTVTPQRTTASSTSESYSQHPQIGLGPATGRTSIYLSFEQQQPTASSLTPKSSLSRATSQKVSPTMGESTRAGRASSIASSSTKAPGSLSSLGRAVSNGTRSPPSSTKDDGFYEEEEPSRSGFKTWLTGGRRGFGSRGQHRGRGLGRNDAQREAGEGPQEESLGIIAASRKSMVDRRRSDISGHYSGSIQNSMVTGPMTAAKTTIE
ncbi:hypothetical protein EMPS_04579 [Entomortierella parvispora]|uniref:RGS domain-containing protein n=1 Tax=Entomortierella parvispora TaxID=205924 RepID=A0A9P3H8W8_9FUNG|nr:hypothetical protein EMPS_04579 [Entomortierella parvispora]